MKGLVTFFFIFIFALQSMIASTLIIVNNSSHTLFVSDGVQVGAILAPAEQYIVQDTSLITLFFYQASRAQVPQTFKLTYRLRELLAGSQPITIAYSDVTSKSLHAKFPGRFEIIPQTRLQFQQEHGAQLSAGKQQVATPKANKQKISNNSSSQAAPAASLEPTQAVVESLISQFSMLQQKQQSVDTTSLKPKRTPPAAPQVRSKK